MNTKKMFKKLTAVATGATMIGATMMGALAADLSEYPDVFVSDGTFDGLFVVGEAAASVDNLAMTDIATNMWVAGSDSAGTTTTVSGDAWLVGTSSKSLELANSNASDSSIVGETFNDIVTFIGEDELGALADGTWSTNEQEHDFQQFMFWDASQASTPGQTAIVKYGENDDDTTDVHLVFKNGQEVGRYKMEFTSTAQSDVTDSSGTATTSGTYLDDFENTELNILGEMYTVVLARRPASTPEDSVKLTLMAGATTDTLQEGQTASYTVEGTTYDVEVTYVDEDEAKFTVNGEATNKLQVGETYVLSDKSEIGVSEVLYQGYAGGIHSTTFFVGAQKMELQDSDVTDNASSHNLKVGSEDIDGADVIVSGTDDNATFSITTIEVNMTAQDDYFVGVGEKLSDVIVAAGDEAEMLFTSSWDIEFTGLSGEETHRIGLDSPSSRRYDLHVFDGDDNLVKIPVAYAEAENNMTMGKDSITNGRTNQERVHWAEGTAIQKDDYFVLTAGTASDGSAKSYLLQYRNSDKSTKTSPKITFKNMGSGEDLEYSVSTSGTVATIKLGGYSFQLTNDSSMGSDDFNLNVSLDGDTDYTDTANPVNFIDSYGSQWAVNVDGGADSGNANQTNLTGINFTMTTPNTDDYDNFVPSTLIYTITADSTPEVRAGLLMDSADNFITPDGETEVKYGWTSMGAFITFSEPSSDPDEILMEYPSEQRLPLVYVTSGATTSSTVSGDLTSVKVVDATKLDSEVASVSAQNLITVGGPCVNTVSAELLGNPADCTEGFTPGVARVKLFEEGTSVAMLVAGYSGEDTRLAGKVVANRWTELSGSEVEIEGTTYSDATISAPSAAPAADDTEETTE